MNYKSILFFLGIYSLFISFFSFLNILYSNYFNFVLDLNSYITTLIISLIIGSFFCLIGKNSRKNITLSDQIILIVLSFVFLPILISIPYYLSLYNVSFINSYFESISGFTTTGFSIIDNVSKIDDPLLLWRSSSQWLGGLVFLISAIGTLGSKQIKIKPNYLLSDSTLGENFYNNFNYNFLRILLIYSLSTLFVFLTYTLTDIRILDSLHLALTTISTGGFLSKDTLSIIINNDAQILILSLAFLFPIFNFYILFKIFTNQFRLIDHQEDFHLGTTIIILTLFFYFFIMQDEGLPRVLFTITSSISTSGISLYNSNFDISLFLILLTIIGGSTISTSSGLKYIRFYILLKISYKEIYRLVKPKNISNQNLFRTDSKIGDIESKIAFLVFISFIISVFALSSILTFENLVFEDSFKLAILTITNTVSSSLYGLDNISFYDLNSFTKVSLIVFMIFGKIEIITVLFLIKKFIFKE